MSYKRLPFADYFIICSQNYNGIKTDLELAKYESISYTHHGHSHSVEFQVRYDVERNCIQIILQQTASKSDWRANFEFPHKIYDAFTFDNQVIQLKVHRGGGDMGLACQDTIRRKFYELYSAHPYADVEIFGGSLGSGLAQLAAEDIYFKFNVRPYLYTFGSVKPFFGRKTYEFVKNCCAEAYNFYDHCDIVGYAVPFCGWRAINHVKVKLERFCITKLFNPYKFHTQYQQEQLYKDVK